MEDHLLHGRRETVSGAGGSPMHQPVRVRPGEVMCPLEELEDPGSKAFAAGDPYAQAGLFSSSVVKPWRLTFPES